jgi:hypothetical protein
LIVLYAFLFATTFIMAIFWSTWAFIRTLHSPWILGMVVFWWLLFVQNLAMLLFLQVALGMRIGMVFHKCAPVVHPRVLIAPGARVRYRCVHLSCDEWSITMFRPFVARVEDASEL